MDAEKRREWEDLFMSVQLAVFKVAGFGHDDDSDLVADLRLHLWRQMGFYDPKRSTFFAFAYTLLVNRKAAYYKRKKLPIMPVGEFDITDRQHSATPEDYEAAMVVLKRKVGEQPYDIWVLVRAGMSIAEIAQKHQLTMRGIVGIKAKVDTFILCGGLWSDWGWENKDKFCQRPIRRRAKRCHPREAYPRLKLVLADIPIIE